MSVAQKKNLDELATWLKSTCSLLVIHPDALKVEVRDGPQGAFIFLVEAHQADVPLLIGKEKQNKLAMRRVLQSAGRRRDLMTDLWIQGWGQAVAGA